MIDPEAAQAVVDAYREFGLPEDMTPEEQDAFLKVESERMAERIFHMSRNMHEHLLAKYMRHNGEPASAAEQRSMRNDAFRDSLNFVIDTEIFGVFPDDFDADPPDLESQESIAERERARIQVHAVDPDRWRNPLNCADTGKAADAVSATLWGDRGSEFWFRGAYLIQAKMEDGEPYPTSRDHPLFESFLALVEELMDELAQRRQEMGIGHSGVPRPMREAD